MFKEFVETKGEFSVGYTRLISCELKFAHHYFHLDFYEILTLKYLHRLYVAISLSDL
jgi:hypothetical protein